MDRRSEAPRIVDKPEPGFFEIAKVRGGPLVGARIVLWDDGTWQAEVAGEWQQPAHEDWVLAGWVARLWLYGRMITEEQYRYRLGLQQWAELNDPGSPHARPDEKIDLNKIASIY